MINTLGNQSNADTTAHPLHRFLGVWTLEDNQWQQRWDEANTETIEIANHVTTCRLLNTQHSVLCEVESPSLSGHILWSFDPITNKVHHLSSFGANRLGFGEGAIDDNGNLSLSIRFPSEGEQTHREYEYKWLTHSSYSLMSSQFRNNEATTNFYAGNFVALTNQQEKE